MGSQIILSICIPTYNRAKYLEDTLLSIVGQKRFKDTNEVEIIISDNCSEDNTKEVSGKFISIYGEKIRYYRNTENIKDLNFEKALSYGRGLFLKLNNDTLIHLSNSLDHIIKIIKDNIKNGYILFFSNGVIRKNNIIYSQNLDSFIENVSFNCTWIGSFGIWKKDFDMLIDFSRYAQLQLVQVDILFRLFALNKKGAIIDNVKLFTSITPNKKYGNDIITIFLINYLYLLREQIQFGMLNKRYYNREKEKVLLQYICYWLVYIKSNRTLYEFQLKNAHTRIINMYQKDIIILIKFYIKYFIYSIYYLIKNNS